MASNTMRIVKILNEHKHVPKSQRPPLPGYKRVMAQVEVGGRKFTRHINIKV